MANVFIRKAYYFCGCTKEYLDDDIPKQCPVCAPVNKFGLSRVSTFQANRIINTIGQIVYSEYSTKKS